MKFGYSFLILCLMVTACHVTKQIDTPDLEKTNINSNPISVVLSVFDAANNNDFTKLKLLCDPDGSGDGDCKSICNLLEAPTKTQKEFVEYFSGGQIVGEPVIHETEAKVPIKFGPGQNRDETFFLIKKEGNWYLNSF